ncbi:MAG: hypothetical protein HAW67_07585 [Endozoicomonadaceae bacterium]|nr:hypothetical protein [Endozoicomonadaceae bacterium]MBE8233585.1 hypothetical protein [Endozoicomonadaceae bacterium]
MDTDKIASRRKIIFLALDAMKHENEKISAQTLAAKVGMGKQTVLPVYREWLEAGILTDAEQVILSDELLYALKRELAKEKFKLSETAFHLSNELTEKNEIIDTLKIEQNNTNESYEKKIKHNALTLDNIQKQNEKLQDQLKNAEQSIDRLSQEKALHLVKITHLMEQIAQLKITHEQAITAQAAQLDESHQKMINHWMKTLDEERQNHQTSKACLAKIEKAETILQKKILTLNYDQTHHIEKIKQLTSKLDTIEKKNTAQQSQINQLHQLHQLFNEPKSLITYSQQLLKRIAHYEILQPLHEECKNELNQLHKKVKTLEGQEKEIIKLRAYIDGLQQIKTIKASSNEY